MLPVHPAAVLALADGSVFHGHSIGAATSAVGEVVFNTALTGYQEILTDPSYASQLVTLTYPHIGNTGVNEQDIESARIHGAGLIIRDLPLRVSNWRAGQSLGEYLAAQGVPGIAGIDTRQLTRLLRDKGAQAGCLVAAAPGQPAPDVDKALAAARAFPGLAGMDLARVVSTDKRYPWTEGTWERATGYPVREPGRWRVVALDFGVKYNILRLLADRGCDLTVLPAQSSAADIRACKPHGLFLSNGPGDPEPCD
ncbi:MAG: carbamoyl phosphate synthase small subunit, partial [Burkholderiaceae bacterium]